MASTTDNVTYEQNQYPQAGAIPIDTKIKTSYDATDGHIQHVVVDSDVAYIYDEILVTYTTTDKDIISKVEWKLSGSIVRTLTPTFGSVTDDWVVT